MAHAPFHLLQIGLRVLNISSLEHSGSILGSVVFTESFLDSRLLVAHPGMCLYHYYLYQHVNSAREERTG